MTLAVDSGSVGVLARYGLDKIIPAPVFNVRGYGAVGDGSHDDTLAIQAAINAAVPCKGRVYIPSGWYLTRTLTIPGDYVDIEGAGVGQTVILHSEAGNVFESIGAALDGMWNTSIHDMSITGNANTNAAIYLIYAHHSWLYGLFINGCKYGVYAPHSWSNYLLNSKVANCTEAGVWLGGESNDWTLENIYFGGSKDGIVVGEGPDAVLGCGSIRMIGVTIEGQKRYALHVVHGWAVSLTGCWIENNNSSNAAVPEVLLTKVQGMSIAGTHFLNWNSAATISLIHASGKDVHGLTISGSWFNSPVDGVVPLLVDSAVQWPIIWTGNYVVYNNDIVDNARMVRNQDGPLVTHDDSAAVDVSTLQRDFNFLLAKLRALGVIRDTKVTDMIPGGFGLMMVDTDLDGMVDGFAHSHHNEASVLTLDNGQKVTLAGVAAANAYLEIKLAASFAVAANTDYQLEVDASLVRSGDEMLLMAIVWHDAGGVYISTKSCPMFDPGEAFSRHRLIVSSPANAALAYIVFQVVPRDIGATGVACFRNAAFSTV